MGAETEVTLDDRTTSQSATGLPGPAQGIETLLALLDGCVDAMQRLEQRMAALEIKARDAVEASSLERSESRTEIATLRTRAKLAETGIDRIQARLASSEAGALGIVAHQEGEVASARADADAWRRRAETAIAGIAGMEDRLRGVETGLGTRLAQTERSLVVERENAARLEERTARSERSATTLAQRLAEASDAAAEQRARIGCLKAKLAIASQAARYNGRPLPVEDAARSDVIDLMGLVEGRLKGTA